jgi:AcrR family transcriptional regulator
MLYYITMLYNLCYKKLQLEKTMRVHVEMEVNMPPRKTIDKAAIIKAAFDIVREAGWEALTARNLAKKLKSSTMPLYSTLKSMEEIKDEIRKMAAEMMQEYQRKPYTKDILLNGAIGYVAFANDEKYLFRFLFMESGQHEEATGKWSDLQPAIPFNREADMEKLFPGLSVNVIKEIIKRGWIFTHGLAAMVNSGIIQFELEEVGKLLSEHGTAQAMLILGALKNPKEGAL